MAFLKFLTFSSGHVGQRHAQKLRIEDGQKVSLGCAACWEELWVGRAAIWSLQLTTDTGGPGSCPALGTGNKEYTPRSRGDSPGIEVYSGIGLLKMCMCINIRQMKPLSPNNEPNST